MKSTTLNAVGRGALLGLLLVLPAAESRAKPPEFYHYSEDGSQLWVGGLATEGLYDETVLRTFELRFAQEDWQAQLAANYSSEVNIPADLIVDGVTYPGVGVRYKGTTSYIMMTGDSPKKSFNIDLEFTDPDQNLMGYETLNLNNSSNDPSFVREVLAFNLYRRYTPSPKANFVKLLINGQNWGVYVNVEQVNNDLIEEWFSSSQGDRWKISSTGGGDLGGGLAPGNIGGGPNPGGQVPVFGDTAAPPGGFFPPADTTLRPPGGRGGPGAPGVPPGGVMMDSLRGQLGPGGLPPDSLRGPGGGGGFTGGPGGGGFASGNGALIWLGADTTAYQGIYELQKRSSADPWGALVRLCGVLNNTPAEVLADSLDQVLDLDGALWYVAVENLLADTDGYDEKGGDYRIFYEEETGRFHLLQYDGNEVMALRSATKDPFEGQDKANRPIISRLLAVPQLRQRYLAHYRTLLGQALDWQEVAPLVQDYRALIEKEVEADSIKLSPYAQFQSDFANIENFVKRRRDYLLSLPDFLRPAPTILAAGHIASGAAKAAQMPAAGQVVQVQATLAGAPVQAVLLHYAGGINGRFSSVAMADDGQHGDGTAGDGVFGGEVPPFAAGTLVRYYIEARAADEAGTAAFAPAGAEHEVYVYQVAAVSAPSTPVVINELMAANSGAVLDPQGEQEDWIELFNTSGRQVDLSGMYLSDSETSPRKWAFPAGTILNPGAYLVVWADEDGGDEPGLHANFKLSAAGEQVLLVDADERGNQVLDRVDFGAQEADLAYGRTPDGQGGFAVLGTPTPGVANVVPTVVLGEPVQPGRFVLAQNYPNPFNGGTTIYFSLPTDQTRAELVVYNLSGQQVAVLLRGPLQAGPHQFQWAGRDDAGRELATGVYLYRLRAGSAVETRRLLLLR